MRKKEQTQLDALTERVETLIRATEELKKASCGCCGDDDFDHPTVEGLNPEARFSFLLGELLADARGEGAVAENCIGIMQTFITLIAQDIIKERCDG